MSWPVSPKCSRLTGARFLTHVALPRLLPTQSPSRQLVESHEGCVVVNLVSAMGRRSLAALVSANDGDRACCMVNAVLGHRSNEETGDFPSTTRADNQQGSSMAGLDEDVPSKPVAMLTLGDNCGLKLVNTREGLADVYGRGLLKRAERNDHPAR